MRGSYPFTAATTPSGGRGTRPVNLGSVKVGAGPAARLSVNVAPGQFRMILRRKRSSCEQQALKLGPGRKHTSSGGRKPELRERKRTGSWIKDR